MLKLIELKFQIIVVIEPKMFLIFRPKGEQNASDLHLDSWNPRLPRQPSCHNMANS